MGLISHGVSNVGTGLGIFSVAGSIGLVTGPFLAGMLNWLAGWRIAYLAIGIFSILWGIAMTFVKINEMPVEREESTHAHGGNSLGHPLQLLLLFFWTVTLGGLAYRINIVSLPAYLEFKAGFLSQYFQNFNIANVTATTTMAAATLTSIIYVVGIIGQLFGGKIADRYNLCRLYLIFNVVSLPFVIFMAVFTQQWLFIVAAAYVFFALGIQPIENSLIAKFTPPKWRSTGYGFASILVFGVGSLAVFLVGWVSERWSLGSVYLFSGVIILLIVVNIVILNVKTRGIIFRNTAKR
jgi:MFS family permease